MIRGVESNVVADQAFVVYQDKMVKALKAIARGAHDMVSIILLFLKKKKNTSAFGSSHKRCFRKFRKIDRKTHVPESLS